MSKFFIFQQRPSGDSYIEPAVLMVIEADDEREANARARKYGIYFRGAMLGKDCDCCGDRWGEVSPNDAVERFIQPLIRVNDDGINVYIGPRKFQIHREVPVGLSIVAVFYRDGRSVHYVKTADGYSVHENRKPIVKGTRVKLKGPEPSIEDVDMGEIGLVGTVEEIESANGKLFYSVAIEDAPEDFKRKCDELHYAWDEVSVTRDQLEPI